MIVVAHVAFLLWKQADLEWPVLPRISQDGRMFFVGSLRNWGMSASVARNVAAGEARLPLRALMCARCLSSTQSSESLRTMASPPQARLNENKNLTGWVTPSSAICLFA